MSGLVLFTQQRYFQRSSPQHYLSGFKAQCISLFVWYWLIITLPGISSTHTEELQLLNWYNFTAGIMREIWKSTTKQLTRCLDSMYTSSTRIVGFVWLPATQCKLFRVALLWFLSEFKDLSRCLSQPSHAGKSVLHFSLSFTLTATFLESLLCVMFLCYW